MGYAIGDWEHALDVYLTNPPEPKESQCKCSYCGDELLEGDDFYDIEGDIYCERCGEAWLERQKFKVTREMAIGEE